MPYKGVLAIPLYACLLGCVGAESEAAVTDESAAGAVISAADACEIVERGTPLPDAVRETSGLARSARDPDLFWTHNDAGGEPELFAIDAGGALAGRVRVTSAELEDWEDVDAAPCGAGACLYMADIGDNDGERDRITVYRVPEPRPDAGRSEPAQALHARFPDGPRDAEALFVDPSGTLYVVNKGDREEIAVYRWPAGQEAGTTVTLERVGRLFPQPQDEDDRVTAASATPDGRWVGIRTYRALHLYRMDALLGGGAAEPMVIDLSPLGEAQGEGLAVADDGTVWLSSEAGGDGEPPRWSRLRCALPGS